MAMHKLVLDDVFEETLYTLIAIHTSIEDYRIAYLLNKHLGINLTRVKADLDVNSDEGKYSIFEWKDNKQLTTWNLVSNICKKEEEVNYNNDASLLFSSQNHITKTYNLLPEFKDVNYFLKIDDEYALNKENYILNSIHNIPQVATTYSVETSQIKTKDNLIFS